MNKSKIKIYAILILVFSTGLFLAYGAGTFNPNKWTVKSIAENIKYEMRTEWKSLGLKEPSIEYNNNNEFVRSVNRCIQWVNFNLDPEKRIPREIILSMAVLETGYGKSRFALEGNNLFGIRTWSKDVPQLKAKGNPDAVWGVKAYPTKCASVKDMIDIINRHPAYEGFRIAREEQFFNNSINLELLVDELHKWSTNPEYVTLVKSKIKRVNDILDDTTTDL